MEFIDYSKNWYDIFQMSPEEIDMINLENMDEEDLDALSIHLEKIGYKEKIIEVYDTMLQSDKTNPGVEYMNIFEIVIVHWMDRKNYIKAANLLESYLLYDEKEKKGYRNHFIRRNLGVCYIFSGRTEEGQKLIDELIHEAPEDYWTYHDLAIEYYFAGEISTTLKYLEMGMDNAKFRSNDIWYNLFQERFQEIINDKDLHP